MGPLSIRRGEAEPGFEVSIGATELNDITNHRRTASRQYRLTLDGTESDG